MIDARILQELAEAAPKQGIYPNPMFPPSIYYRFLRLLTGRMKPECSVELGICGGGGSLHMALGHPDGLVIGIDVANDYPTHIEYVIETCPNVRFWRMDSIEAAIEYEAALLPPVSILFIDTIHTYERTMAEFAAWRSLLAADAVVVLDDLFRDGMDRVWRELPGEKARFDLLHIGGVPTDGGFGVVYNIR